MKELEQPAKISPSSAINSSWVEGGWRREGAGWGGGDRNSSCCRHQQIKNERPKYSRFIYLFLFFPRTWASPAPARPGAAGAGCGRGRGRRGARRGARPPARSPERRGPAPGRGAPAPRTGTAPRTPRTPLQEEGEGEGEGRGCEGREVKGHGWMKEAEQQQHSRPPAKSEAR